MSSINSLVGDFLDLVMGASFPVAFTGAGISTESGIPDYRSPGTGTWEQMDPSVVSLDGFYADPAKYYRYALEMYPIRSKAGPNQAHSLLATLEAKELVQGVITQNVDGLHHKAGSRRVYELHGSLREAECLNCGVTYPMDEIMERVKGGEIPPLCTGCNGRLLKPKAVFFGEELPQNTWQEAMALVEKSDLLIVIGSSLQVSPANLLPNVIIRSGGKLIIINLMPTPYDEYATLLIREKAGGFASVALEILRTRMRV